MNPWVKRKWLRALRSGEYGKGKGLLGKPGQDQYCCLGVLVCEMVPEFVAVSIFDEIAVSEYYDRHSYLPDDLAVMYGLDYDTQHELGEINDRSDTFAPVIAYIESNL